MIVGIGTDIIEIDRIRSAMSKSEHSFLKRVFSEQEIKYYKMNHYNISSVAGGFAAKEAVMKALGTGLRGFKLIDIEILRDDLGKPFVVLHNHADRIAKEKAIQIIHLSISHCQQYATAYAVAEKD
ncbi:MAG: holo-ACP synthase [Clostridia bacterium]|nr:holo-ACP synthase [Clostridia bacterium]